MTRKDFEAIAAELAIHKPDGETRESRHKRQEWITICLGFVAMLEHHNSRFDRSRFLKACGMEE